MIWPGLFMNNPGRLNPNSMGPDAGCPGMSGAQADGGHGGNVKYSCKQFWDSYYFL
jgi:hypothetical protein